MSNIFTGVNFKKPGSNIFDRSHEVKMTTDFGDLVPVLVEETVPGDQHSISSQVFLRFAPLIAPVMHRVNIYVHYFFVPHRIVFPQWEDFITGGETGMDQTTWPYLETDLSASQVGNLFDYMGLPVGQDVFGSSNYQISALPFVSYNKIYNEYYRDQNLEPTPFTDEAVPGLNAQVGGLTSLKQRSYAHDYFTSAQNATQKGPEAMIPLGTTAPIQPISPTPPNGIQQKVKNSLTGGDLPGTNISVNYTDAFAPLGTGQVVDNAGVNPSYIDVSTSHIADLSNASASSIIDLRRAFKLQEWLEKNQRGGSRYTESILVHFGVKSSDARLQRPEFLGGFKTPVAISEVLQTSSSGFETSPVSLTPQGNMAGHGLSVGSGKYISHYSEEHGYIIGLMSVMPRACYQQGIHRKFRRMDKFDYFWPEFQHIGEEPILNSELWNDGQAGDNEVFGYKPRYAEYKFEMDRVAGDYRTTLDFWHMGRKFTSRPALNTDFIKTNPADFKRIFAVFGDGSTQFKPLWCQINHKIKAKRPMAYYGNPKF